MRAGRGEWVIHDGVRMRESGLDRGRLLLSTEREQRRRMGRFIVTTTILIGSPICLVLVIVWALNPSGILDWLLLFILLEGAIIWPLGVLLALFYPRKHVPGIYVNGVQLIDRTFLPFEEVECVSIKESGWWRGLTLHLRRSKATRNLLETVYGTEGFDYVMARTSGRMGGADTPPPRLVVYPREDGE